MNKDILRLQGIDKAYNRGLDGEVTVLKGLDLAIAPAQVVALVAPSGAGKSTLLHIIGTLDRPDQGELLFENQDLFSLEPDEMAGFRNRKIGFVFQFHNLLQGFTAVENVMIPCMINQKNGMNKLRFSIQSLSA